MNLASLLSLLCMVVAYAAPVEAVSNLILSPGSGSTYVLSGQGVENAVMMECMIAYDPALLGSPKVDLGPLAAGDMLAVNSTTPGAIRIALFRTTPMSGSGTIATIAFELKGGSAGRVTITSAKMKTLDGKPLTVAVQVVGQAEIATVQDTTPAVQEAVPRQGMPAVIGGTTTTQPAPLTPSVGWGGNPEKPDGRRRPNETTGQQEKTAVQNRPAPAAEPSRIAKREDIATPSASRKIYSQMSVLERFRDFRGKPTVPAYLALFDQDEMIGFRQDPPVALADGRSRVTVTFISSSPTRTNSDIAVMGATLLSLMKDPDATNIFIIELLPAKGELKASISVPQDTVLMVFPLTVAPKVDIANLMPLKVDEAAFQAFLANRGTPQKPKFDLNGDGRRDYLDDYLFTANYIAARERAKGSTARH